MLLTLYVLRISIVALMSTSLKVLSMAYVFCGETKPDVSGFTAQAACPSKVTPSVRARP